MENNVFFSLFFLCAIFHQGIATPVDMTSINEPCYKKNGLIDLEAGGVYYYFDESTNLCYPFIALKVQKESENAFTSLLECEGSCNVSRPYSWETLQQILEKLNNIPNIDV